MRGIPAKDGQMNDGRGGQRVRKTGRGGAWSWVLVALAVFALAAEAADPAKVLRLSANDIDTFDPHQYNDFPSYEVQRAIFEGLYEWDYLASPAKLAPVLAAGPP